MMAGLVRSPHLLFQKSQARARCHLARGPTANDGRETMMRRRDFCAALLAAPALIRSAAAQPLTIRIAKQYGLPYLALMVMESHRLVEKHAQRLGLENLRIEWPQVGGAQPMVEGV